LAPRIDKACAHCSVRNPVAAKFCGDCGRPFAKDSAPPPKVKPASARRLTDDLAADEARALAEAHARAADTSAAVEAARAAAKTHAMAKAPFAAMLLAEGGGAFALEHNETTIGGTGARIAIENDAFVAPRAATIAFRGDRIVLRDEGSVNGIYLKVRDSVTIAPGDSFIAGERLFRFDGPTDLPKGRTAEDTIVLGAPRPRGACVRVSEVLAGGRAGRTCYRSGPVIVIGRGGCDMSFPGDRLLAQRHAEIRLGRDGEATLVDLQQSAAGILLRVRTEAELKAGDVLRVGGSNLRLQL
jgi:hypothetical protein